MGRIDKVNQQLKREIGNIIQRELSDPRLEFVTITSVDISRDLKHARVYFSFLGSSDQIEAAQKSLDGASGTVRKYVGGRMKMRYTPELFFIYDKSIEFSSKMDKILKEIHNEPEEDHSYD